MSHYSLVLVCGRESRPLVTTLGAYSRRPTIFSDVGGPALAARAGPTLQKLAPFWIVPAGCWVGSTPVWLVFSGADESMEGGPTPISNVLHEIVLARIPVDIVGAALQIV